MPRARNQRGGRRGSRRNNPSISPVRHAYYPGHYAPPPQHYPGQHYAQQYYPQQYYDQHAGYAPQPAAPTRAAQRAAPRCSSAEVDAVSEAASAHVR